MYRHTTVLLLCVAMALGAKASLTASGAGIETAHAEENRIARGRPRRRDRH